MRTIDQLNIADVAAAQAVRAWKETGRPLAEMDVHEMTVALAKRFVLVTTPGGLSRITEALRAAKERG
jgi:hypothetical protein